MSYFKKYMRWFLTLSGMSLGIYVGLWILLVGGVIQIIGEIQAENISSVNVLLGLLKIIFAKPIGLLMYIPFIFLSEKFD